MLIQYYINIYSLVWKLLHFYVDKNVDIVHCLLTYLLHHKFVFRTALATPDILIIENLKIIFIFLFEDFTVPNASATCDLTELQTNQVETKNCKILLKLTFWNIKLSNNTC